MKLNLYKNVKIKLKEIFNMVLPNKYLFNKILKKLLSENFKNNR